MPQHHSPRLVAVAAFSCGLIGGLLAGPSQAQPAFVLNPDAYTVKHDNPLAVPAGTGFLANDTGVATAVLITDGVDFGSLTAFPDGHFNYTPAPGFFGLDSFVYRAVDTTGLVFGTATVTITVTNLLPNANPDSYSVKHGTVLTVPAPGFLANDSDGDDPVVANLIVNPVAHGSLTAFPGGNFVYTPGGGFAGLDSFTYRISDGAATSEAVVTITVTNLLPVALADFYLYTPDTALSVPALTGFLANDSDGDDPVVANAIVDGVDHGSLTAFPDGRFTYNPDAGFSGVDTFRYRIGDGVASATALVTLSTEPISPDPGGRVPAPATWLLIAAGLGVLIALRHRATSS